MRLTLTLSTKGLILVAIPMVFQMAFLAFLVVLQHKNAELRGANTDLTEHLALAVANIQRLTLDNHLLREALETTQKVTRLPSRPGIS